MLHTVYDNLMKSRKRCKEIDCFNFSIFNGLCRRHGLPCTYEGCTKKCTSTIKFCVDHSGKKQLCSFDGCKKSCNKYTKRCGAHGPKCNVAGCNSAVYTHLGTCQKHANVTCSFDGCISIARGANKTCRKHNPDYKCISFGCTSTSIGKTKLCKRHLGGLRCSFGGCQSSATDKRLLCGKHGGHRKCTVSTCSSRARSKSEFCTKHGANTCNTIGCTTGAQGSSGYCIKCGGGDARCISCSLWSVRRKGDMCYVCRKGIGRTKKFECETLDFLNSKEDLCLYSQHDQRIPCCIGAKIRPDIIYILPDRWVILEIDEHEHKNYNCVVAEVDRLHELRDQLNVHKADMYMVVIRYNPNEPYRSLNDKHAILYKTITDAFTTNNVINAECGILKIYLGYTGQQKRKLDSQYNAEYDRVIKRVNISL